MSLNITSEITTRDGFVLPTSYGRVAVTDNYGGENLDSSLDIFKDEAAFLAGDSKIQTTMSINNIAPYDRDVEGVDILDLAHNRIMDKLSEYGIRSEKNL
jgi:hypothetical protein